MNAIDVRVEPGTKTGDHDAFSLLKQLGSGVGAGIGEIDKNIQGVS